MKLNSFYYFHIKKSSKQGPSIFIFKNSFHFLIKHIFKKRQFIHIKEKKIVNIFILNSVLIIKLLTFSKR